MNLGTCRNRAAADGKIHFPALECWNPQTRVASIAAQVNGRRIMCKISLGVLQEKFNASKDTPMQSVRQNRPSIEAAARQLIEDKAYDDDGAVNITLKHL